MNNKFEVLSSEQDASVNFVADIDVSKKKAIEARFVQRDPSYFIAYLSSQTGCKQGCNMCHLTATGQVNDQNLTAEEFCEQLKLVLNYASSNLEKTGQLDKVKSISVNFMARGEPLANRLFTSPGNNDKSILSKLADVASTEFPFDVALRFNVSTIYPKTYKGRLSADFSPIQPTFYYSLYSMDPEFRRKWVPSAQDPRIALDSFAEYQVTTSKILKIHAPSLRAKTIQ